MSTPSFFQKPLAGKNPRVGAVAVRVLDLYLSAPAWNRDETASDRKAHLRRILEESVSKTSKDSEQ